MRFATGAAALALIASVAPFAFAENPPLTETFSSTAPTPPASTAQNPIPVTVTFSKGVTDFSASDLGVGNGSVTNFASTSDSVYTFGIIPAASGSVSVDLNGGVVTGADGQQNEAASQLQFIYDPNAGDATTTATSTGSGSGDTATSTDSGSASTTAPAISITSPADGASVASSSLEFDFTFSPADASVSCQFGDATTSYACGSPQIFGSDSQPLPSGTYPFTVFAQNSAGSATSSVTVNYTFASSTASSTPVLGCTDSSATNFNASATQDDGSCTFASAGGGTPAPSGGGGGGGGMIVGSGPLAPGYVNTNPYGSPYTPPQPGSGNTTGGSSPVATNLPPNAGFPMPGQVLGASTQNNQTQKKTAPLAVNTGLTSSNTGFSSSSATSTSSTSVAEATTSTTTPGIPNTGASSATSVWVWVVGVILLLIIIAGAWLLLSEAY